MNRLDWILTGMCLYGVHLMATGLLAIVAVITNPGLVQMDAFSESMGVELPNFRTGGFVQAVATSFLGSVLVWLSMKIGASQSRRALYGGGDGTAETAYGRVDE